MDPDYQKYKESLHLEAEPHDEEADEAFYKDFANYDYTPFLERDDALALTMGETTVATDPVANNNNKEKEKQQELVETVRPAVADMPVHVRPLPGFNVVLTHCTADFDSLASAVGLAKRRRAYVVGSLEATSEDLRRGDGLRHGAPSAHASR